MTQQLEMRQRNNLLVGNRLAAEITATSGSRRAFMVVTPYREEDTPQYDSLGRRKAFSKFLDADHSDVRFNVLVFEVDVTALATYKEVIRTNYGYDATIEVNKLAFYPGIVSLERLEEVLNHHLSDLASLDVDWRVVPWWD